jgi:mannose-6-phosphate isomerase-like protein (cupin superfamily)
MAVTELKTEFGRVITVNEVYGDATKFIDILSPGRTEGVPVPSVAQRTSGKPQFRGANLWQGGAGHHLIQLAEIAPGDRKYLHRHHHAETVWLVLEGEGEYYPELDVVVPVAAGTLCHAYPWEWHGLGNTSTNPLRYLSVEGPMFMRQGASEFAE